MSKLRISPLAIAQYLLDQGEITVIDLKNILLEDTIEDQINKLKEILRGKNKHI